MKVTYHSASKPFFLEKEEFLLNPFMPPVNFSIPSESIKNCVALHIKKTSHIICTENQMTGFYMQCNTIF